MINKTKFVLPLVLVFAGAMAFGDDSGSKAGKPVTLERAVLDFNEETDGDREKLGLPRLTENEVIAAIRGTTGMQPEDYKLFSEIADSKKLPANAKLLLFGRRFANAYKSSVWNIVLTIKKSEEGQLRVEVRNQYLSTEKHNPFLSSVQTSK